MELFGVKLNYLELKLMKRNVLGVSPSIDRTLDKTCYNSIYNSIYHSIYNTIWYNIT